MSDLKILELFNTKAEKIHRSKFLEYLNREREVTCRITNDQVEVRDWRGNNIPALKIAL